ncbi:MAG: ABC transporter substrate-binding protein, partial [Acidimicrobiales bacterium]|nr:ABC transporter substrate-binding protein [Acidimicrobiales bacterium]
VLRRDQRWARRGAVSLPWRAIGPLGAVLVLACAVLAGFGGSPTSRAQASGSAPIVVGEDTALTGSFDTLGTNNAHGAEALAQYLNKHGGVLGRKIKIVTANDQSTPSVAAASARQLVEGGAKYVLGAETGATAAGLIPIGDSLQVVTILQDGTSWPPPGIPSSQATGWVFPAGNSIAAEELETVVQDYVLPNHLSRVALVVDSTPFGLEYPSILKAYAAKSNFSVSSSQVLPPGATNDTAQVINMLGTKPDAIVLGTSAGADTVTAIKAIRAVNTAIPVLGCLNCTNPSFTAAVGGASAMNHVYSIAAVTQFIQTLPHTKRNQPTFAEAKTYLSGLKAAGFTSTGDLNGDTYGWASLDVLVHAIKKAHSFDESRVRDALRTQHLDEFGVFWQRKPTDYGAYDQSASVVGLELTNHDGTYSPYQPTK